MYHTYAIFLLLSLQTSPPFCYTSSSIPPFKITFCDKKYLSLLRYSFKSKNTEILSIYFALGDESE